MEAIKLLLSEKNTLRQIRTSKSSKTMRAYTLGMYVNEGDVQICQMCKKPAPFVDVTEIANYGIEMPQLSLCLCKNCSSRYKQLRDGSKEKFKEEMTKAIRGIDIESPAEDYEIYLSSDTAVHFTQMHLAEVKEILSLLEQYGIPGQEEQEKPESARGVNVAGPLPHPPSEKKSVYVADHRQGINREDRYHGQGRGQKKERNPARNQQNSQPASVPATGRRNEAAQTLKQGKKELRVGVAVRHKTFGDGQITYVDGSHLGVHFSEVGYKKFSRDAFKKGFLTLIE